MAGGVSIAHSRKATKKRVSETAVNSTAAVPAKIPGKRGEPSPFGLRTVDKSSGLKRLDRGLPFAALERLKRSLNFDSEQLAEEDQQQIPT
jgi:hypothetical protein